MAPRESERPKHRERSHHYEKRRPHKSRHESASSQSGSKLLSADALAKLNQLNQQSARSTEVTPKKTRRKRHRDVIDEKIVVEKRRDHKRRKRRVVSGALLEEGDSSRLRGLRGGERYEKEYDGYNDGKERKRLCRLFQRRGVTLLTLAARAFDWCSYGGIDNYNSRCRCGQPEEKFNVKLQFELPRNTFEFES
jgi:glucan 1,3-beta-glucosidase